jgi:hypothetical protein
MKKLFLLFIISVCSSSYAINPFTYFWTIKLTGDTATVAKWKANNDSVLNWSSRISDTVTSKVPRKTDFSDHSYTFKWMNIDTLPSVDTASFTVIKSQRARIDTLKSVKKIDTLAACDTAKMTRAKVVYSYLDTIKNVDSLFAKKTNITFGNFDTTSTRAIRSAKSKTGTMTVDTLTQNTRSTDVWVQKLKGKRIDFDTINGVFGGVLADTGSFLCTLKTNNAYVASGRARYFGVGNMITIVLPSLIGTLQDSVENHVTIPAAYQATEITTINVANYIVSSGSIAFGLVQYASGVFSIYGSNTKKLPAGTGGFNTLCITYKYR